jgi:hypothetical protein
MFLDHSEYRQINLDCIDKFDRLSRGELEIIEDPWDSEDDLGDYEFKIDDKVDFL